MKLSIFFNDDYDVYSIKENRSDFFEKEEIVKVNNNIITLNPSLNRSYNEALLIEIIQQIISRLNNGFYGVDAMRMIGNRNANLSILKSYTRKEDKRAFFDTIKRIMNNDANLIDEYCLCNINEEE